MAAKFPHQVQVKAIHFFKIITTHNLHEGKLMIPHKFVKKYGEGLPNSLFLKTPNGAKWKMILEKRDGKIWFQKGWKEFAEYHSLAHGHILVFRCERTSHFQVHIFDLSALEIDYPSKRIEGKEFNNQGNEPPSDENLECHRPSQKRKVNSTVEFLQPCQMRSRKCAKVENTLILPKEALRHTDTKCKEKSKATANHVTALDRASSFKPCNPFFLVVLRQSYVGSHCVLNLPNKFCRTHFDLDKKQTLIINLKVLNGSFGLAKFRIYKDNKKRTKFRLTGGWKAFVKNNNLKFGDVCIFEIINRTKLTFLVHIFRETDTSNCSTSKESGQTGAACQGERYEMKTINATK